MQYAVLGCLHGNLEALRAVMADIKQRGVDRIVCGHMHRPITSTIAGIPAEVAVSTAVHVALDLDPQATARIIRDPVGYRLHVVDGDSIVSHTRYVGTGEAPFAPAWAAEYD